MNESVLLRYSGAVPRYTSYPTAVSFSSAVDGSVYRSWLGEIEDGDSVSLYFHVPFCRSLCWFCGCQTTVARDRGIIADYAWLLATEVDMVRSAVPARVMVRHLHLGGGTPTILGSEGLRNVIETVRERFPFSADAELAIETDPRTLTPEVAQALGALGFNRASLGIQDLDPQVQRSVNRVQPLADCINAATLLRDNGIANLSIDLMIGLPHQTTAGVRQTVADAVDALDPSRVSVFAYAHVPWMKHHQKLIDAKALPDARERLKQAGAAAEALTQAGYVPIGLDHFARPNDSLATAARCGTLHRNFQGYTDDPATILIGFGASAIGSLASGYVQNAHLVPDYRRAIGSGAFATSRGTALSRDDRLRREIIERLMCDLHVDLREVADRRHEDPRPLHDALAALSQLEADG
ncbi:MAG: oxygen-independent coproporphyrinogen III oxidase, partial [Alphaproteobacteria bacterium]